MPDEKETGKKNKWLSVVLNFIFWGAGHYYAGDYAMGLILMAIDVILFLFIPNILVTYWYVFLMCTALVCYDGYKKISAYNEELIHSEKLVNRYMYRTVIVIGIILFLSNFFFADPLYSTVLMIAGAIVIIAGYRMKRRLDKARQTEAAVTKRDNIPRPGF